MKSFSELFTTIFNNQFVTTGSMLLMLLALAAGCSKEEVEKVVSEVKSTASETVAKVEPPPVLNLNGKGSMNLDAPTNFSSSYIRVIPLDGGVAALQIKSNKVSGTTSYPSFLIQGEVNVKTVDELVGQSVPCRVFAQKAADEGVWSNMASEPITVTIQKSDSKFTAKFDQGSLANSTSESTTPASGSFECATF